MEKRFGDVGMVILMDFIKQESFKESQSSSLF